MPSKNFRMIVSKLHILANIGLTGVIYTPNEKGNNMQLADEVSFVIYF